MSPHFFKQQQDILPHPHSSLGSDLHPLPILVTPDLSMTQQLMNPEGRGREWEDRVKKQNKKATNQQTEQVRQVPFHSLAKLLSAEATKPTFHFFGNYTTHNHLKNLQLQYSLNESGFFLGHREHCSGNTFDLFVSGCVRRKQVLPKLPEVGVPKPLKVCSLDCASVLLRLRMGRQ